MHTNKLTNTHTHTHTHTLSVSVSLSLSLSLASPVEFEHCQHVPTTGSCACRKAENSESLIASLYHTHAQRDVYDMGCDL